MNMLLGFLAKLFILMVLTAGCVVAAQQRLPERNQVYILSAVDIALLLYVSR